MAPVLSIITVCYNPGQLLRGTIESVLAQTYPRIEYVIIDGASTDGSVALVESYGDRIAHFSSEPDSGLYDAMNKGLVAATGDFVWFMNAGDQVFSPTTAAEVMAKVSPRTDVLYGEVMLVNDQRKHLGPFSETRPMRLPERLDWTSLQRGMVVCHQGFIPRRNIAPRYMLDNLAADIDWVIECLKASRETVHTQLLLAEYLAGGVSKQQHRASLLGRYRILRKQYGFLPNLVNHARIVVRAGVHRVRRRGRVRY